MFGVAAGDDVSLKRMIVFAMVQDDVVYRSCFGGHCNVLVLPHRFKQTFRLPPVSHVRAVLAVVSGGGPRRGGGRRGRGEGR